MSYLRIRRFAAQQPRVQFTIKFSNGVWQVWDTLRGSIAAIGRNKHEAERELALLQREIHATK